MCLHNNNNTPDNRRNASLPKNATPGPGSCQRQPGDRVRLVERAENSAGVGICGAL